MKMQEERRLEKGAREEERTKREVEEEGGGSQEKKRKVLEQAPSSYWDWLPPELKGDIEKKALYALIQERLDKGFCEILFNSHVLLLDLSVVFFSFHL